MNRNLKTIIVLTLCLASIAVSAQRPAAPILKLSPEASAEYLKIDAQMAEIVRAYNETAERRRLLMVGAGIPVDAIPNKPVDGIVTFTPKPSPKP